MAQLGDTIINGDLRVNGSILGGDVANSVTLDTVQTITGTKTFTSPVYANLLIQNGYTCLDSRNIQTSTVDIGENATLANGVIYIVI